MYRRGVMKMINYRSSSSGGRRGAEVDLYDVSTLDDIRGNPIRNRRVELRDRGGWSRVRGGSDQGAKIGDLKMHSLHLCFELPNDINSQLTACAVLFLFALRVIIRLSVAVRLMKYVLRRRWQEWKSSLFTRCKICVYILNSFPRAREYNIKINLFV